MNCTNYEADLTAYVLGELEGGRRDQVAGHLAECAACRRAVAEIERTADRLRRELADEPLMPLGGAERAGLLAAGETAKPAAGRRPRLPLVFGLVGGAVAAALLLAGAWLAVQQFTAAGPRATISQSPPGPAAAPASADGDSVAGPVGRPAPAPAPSPMANLAVGRSPSLTDPAGRLYMDQPLADERSTERDLTMGADSIVRSIGGNAHRTPPTDPAGARQPSSQQKTLWDNRNLFAVREGLAPYVDAPGTAAAGLSRHDVLKQRLADWQRMHPEGDAFGGSHERQPGFNTEGYDAIVENPFLAAADNPLSTFSIDVDTASYSNVRRFLTGGQLPPRGAVRIEELLNYFDYAYPPPDDGEPFSASIETAGCPWALEHRLVRIGLKGRVIDADKRPATNLVFLLDVSGSMQDSNKLPLVKQAMRMLVGRLGENDVVSIVVYAGAAGQVLPPTRGDVKEKILDAIERLEAGGSTAGGAGIQLAYTVAADGFIKGGVNRVILCTDGDFNVGASDDASLVKLIEEKAKSGVFLTVLGFGMGNLKDSKMEKLADKGNGHYGYIDTPAEARKMLVDQLAGTLVTIAKDVKVQVEFNPKQVAAYRLIGYENRMLAKEDFNDDTKDAGEIGAGHTVTALYEVAPAAGVPATQPEVGRPIDPLRYQRPAQPTAAADSGEMLTLKLRYKAPDGDVSKLLQFPATDRGAKYSAASGDFKFAASVAAFGLLLRDSRFKGTASYEMVSELAGEGRGPDRNAYRAEFIELVNRARQLARQDKPDAGS